VRFLLSPPPEGEETMATRSSQRLQERATVTPTAPKEEEIKFGSSSKWGSEQLGLLKVTFEKAGCDLSQVLGWDEFDWPPEVQARIFHFVVRTNTCRG
jgi:hypothetical protein